MAPRKEPGKGKEVQTGRSRSRSTHSIPGSFEENEEEDTVIQYERREEERGRTIDQQEEWRERLGDVQNLGAGDVRVEREHWKAIIDRFNKMKAKNKEYRQREEELQTKLLEEQNKLAEGSHINRNLQKELEEAKKPERSAPQKVELSRLRIEVAALRQENSDLRREITPEARPALRSPPPTELHPRQRLFEETDEEIEVLTSQNTVRRPRLAFASSPAPAPTPAPIFAPAPVSVPAPVSTQVPDSIVVSWRPRGDHPTEKLSGTEANKYRPWRFQIDAKLETDSPLYPSDKRKITYALTQMTDPIFSAMQEWVIAHTNCQLEDFMREIRLYMGLQFQAHESERTLLTITQKDKESITEYYHRVSALWNLAQTSERQRIHKFLTSIRPTIGTALFNCNFASVAEALESARIVEERRKDMETNYPRTFNRSRTSNQPAATKQSQSTGGGGVSEFPITSPRTGSHPNNRFGAVAKRPHGWVGNWYDPEDNPKRITEELKKELTRQGRCWACRGSGHRGADKVCPRSKRLNSETIKDALTQPDSDTESEKE